MNTEEGVVTPQAEDDTCFSQHLLQCHSGLLQFKGTRGDSKNNVKQFIVHIHVLLFIVKLKISSACVLICLTLYLRPFGPVHAQCRHRVMVQHRRYDANNGDTTRHIDNMSPVSQLLVKS